MKFLVYFDEAGIFAANVFYREIDNIIISGSQVVDGTVYSSEAIAGEEWTLSRLISAVTVK